MSAPRRYRKNPVEIEAVQWEGTDDSVNALLEFTDDHGTSASGQRTVRTLFMALPSDDACDVLGGQMRERVEAGYTAVVYDTLHGTWVNVSTGDWIIRGLQGEFYPCRPDVFADTYQAVQ